jgi:hypothetical protein
LVSRFTITALGEVVLALSAVATGAVLGLGATVTVTPPTRVLPLPSATTYLNVSVPTKVEVDVYTALEPLIATRPLGGCVTLERLKVSFSGSVSFANTRIVTGAPEVVLAVSATALGRELVVTVTVTVPVAVPPLPSLNE